MGWPLILAVLGASAAQGAYSASQSRKAQKKAREEANTRELIEGSAPNLSNVAEVIAEDVQGTDVAGLEAALAAMDYQGGEVPIPSGEPLPMEDPTADLSEAELMALIEQSGIAQMASGGPVGTPEDVYYFNVPQVMEMMQDPNPQIQGVGMQLADIMSSTPGMDMVPATRDQITMMAHGGAVTAKKFEDGGSTLLEKISGVSPDELDWAKSIDERLYPDEGLDGRGDAARHLALGSLFAKSKNPELGEALGIAREYIPFPDAGRDMDIFNNELGMTLKGTQEEIEEKIKELIEDKKAQYLTRQESYKLRGYAEGGPISEERLNQLRLR